MVSKLDKIVEIKKRNFELSMSVSMGNATTQLKIESNTNRVCAMYALHELRFGSVFRL